VRKFDEFTATQNKKFDEFTASQRIQSAEANALLQTNTANSFKWMRGSVVAIWAVWIGSVNLITAKPAAMPAPVVIYAQAAPASRQFGFATDRIEKYGRLPELVLTACMPPYTPYTAPSARFIA
jgi:PAB1-binding protein PBP1